MLRLLDLWRDEWLFVDLSSVPTPFVELNGVLEELVRTARDVMGDDFVGAYLQGSFALDAGDLESDCDFLVVVRRRVTSTQEKALRSFHDELPTRKGFWNRHLEGSYAPKDELRTVEGIGEDWLYIDHGWREMQWSQHCNSAVVRWILHERGVALAGPPASELVEAVPKGVLRERMRHEIPTLIDDLLSWVTFDIAWAQRYAVTCLCRMWFTFETEEIISKRGSLEWAKGRLGSSWHPLIQNAIEDRALGWNPGQKPDARWVAETYDFAELVTKATSA